MSLQASIIATAVLSALGLGGGIVFLTAMPVREANETSGPLGTALGVVTAIGVSAIWLPRLISRHRRRQAAQEQIETLVKRGPKNPRRT
ncbi:MAG: hypothetical protein AAF907_12930 [Planctomycetota bacterium]